MATHLPWKEETAGSNPATQTVYEAEAVEALDCESRVSEFESRRTPHFARKAQLEEHSATNGEDVGSTPTAGTDPLSSNGRMPDFESGE